MMQLATQSKLAEAEYLAIERRATVKSEFFDGEMFAMAGGTEAHSLIAGNVIRKLGNQLEDKPCKVYTSDMRLKVEKTGLYAYPDVQVACGGSRFEDEKCDTLLNPKVIFEVLSDSTAAWDRGNKFWNYRQIESLTEYVLIPQDTWRVERYSRQPNGMWLLETFDDPDGALDLPTIACRLTLQEIYSKTEVQAGGRSNRAGKATT
jgi:Uma2 family endonuclease